MLAADAATSRWLTQTQCVSDVTHYAQINANVQSFPYTNSLYLIRIANIINVSQ